MIPTDERLPLIGIPAGSQKPPAVAGMPDRQFNSNYPAAIAGAGGAPMVIPLGLPEPVLRSLFDRLDGLCLAGGEDVGPQHYGEAPHPRLKTVDDLRDADELLLTRWALESGLPLLGICRGIQLLNVAAGGSLYQDIEDQTPGALHHSYSHDEAPWDRPTHHVRIATGSQLGTILGREAVMTNSFHHQAVRRVANGFTPVAWTEDGVVEAIEDRSHPFVMGVQWHPEGMFRTDEAARTLFEAFIKAASDRPARRSSRR